MLPFLSIAMSRGLTPVVPRIVDVPFGVIFVTLFDVMLAV